MIKLLEIYEILKFYYLPHLSHISKWNSIGNIVNLSSCHQLQIYIYIYIYLLCYWNDINHIHFHINLEIFYNKIDNRFNIFLLAKYH